MTDILIRAVCDIALLPAASQSGGRVYASGMRPNHFIRQLGYYVIGQVEFDGRDSLSTGERAIAKVSFIGDEAFSELARPGFEWDICEGAHTIGVGRIVRLQPDA